MDNNDTLAKQFWALGDPQRLKILQLLPHTPNSELHNNVSQLAEILGLSQPTISHHLRILRQAGLVSHKKMCRDCFYWIELETRNAVLESMRIVLQLDCKEEAIL